MADKQFIKPIVEFFELDIVDSKRGANVELFGDMWEDKTHRYLQGAKQALMEAHGIYLFYDSRGRAIYAGKAEAQTLWKEMNLALNRGRGDVQSIKKVSHPTKNIAFKSHDEKKRRIRRQEVRLWEIASYFSAYEISPSKMIPMFEALIIRAFANDLLNKKMETI